MLSLNSWWWRRRQVDFYHLKSTSTWEKTLWYDVDKYFKLYRCSFRCWKNNSTQKRERERNQLTLERKKKWLNIFWQNGTSKNRILRKGIKLFLKRHYLQTPNVGQSISTATARWLCICMNTKQNTVSNSLPALFSVPFLFLFSFALLSFNFFPLF